MVLCFFWISWVLTDNLWQSCFLSGVVFLYGIGLWFFVLATQRISLCFGYLVGYGRYPPCPNLWWRRQSIPRFLVCRILIRWIGSVLGSPVVPRYNGSLGSFSIWWDSCGYPSSIFVPYRTRFRVVLLSPGSRMWFVVGCPCLLVLRVIRRTQGGF
jgi:hypothetical protein